LFSIAQAMVWIDILIGHQGMQFPVPIDGIAIGPSYNDNDKKSKPSSSSNSGASPAVLYGNNIVGILTKNDLYYVLPFIPYGTITRHVASFDKERPFSSPPNLPPKLSHGRCMIYMSQSSVWLIGDIHGIRLLPLSSLGVGASAVADDMTTRVNGLPLLSGWDEAHTILPLSPIISIVMDHKRSCLYYIEEQKPCVMTLPLITGMRDTVITAFHPMVI
jgi:hypothetical protein